jgi:cob(I)alamin adenosyltransferase
VTRIYTRTGDAGETGLIGGRRVSKDDPRVEAYGTLDEANGALGVLAAHVDGDTVAEIRAMQRALFDIGAVLASPQPGALPPVAAEATAHLEALIDGWEAALDPLRVFILPGGSAPAAFCHLARTVVRRAERRVVSLARTEPLDPEILRYLNRLSDALFVMARVLNRRAGITDLPWEARRGR